MTTYKISNIEVNSFNSYVKDVVVDCEELTIEVDDFDTDFEEREELINETMCKELGLSRLDYSVNCTYEVIESDCEESWREE